MADVKNRYPMNIDTSNWGAFGTDPHDDACERERKAFTLFMAKRLRARRNGREIDEKAVFVGAVMSFTQLMFAMVGNRVGEEHRQKLHETLDWAWLQCEGMARGTEGESVQ